MKQTETHEIILLDVFEKIGLDPDAYTPGRVVVQYVGASLVDAMEMSLSNENSSLAQLVACECVVLAETKDHLNWQLLNEYAKNAVEYKKILNNACDKVTHEEDEHLFHSKGWARELWMEFLGLPAVIPPPEEVKKVKSAMSAVRAEKERAKLL